MKTSLIRFKQCHVWITSTYVNTTLSRREQFRNRSRKVYFLEAVDSCLGIGEREASQLSPVGRSAINSVINTNTNICI